MNRFNQTPFQLGFTQRNDVALLYRSLEAQYIFTVGKKAQADLNALPAEEAAVLLPLSKAINKVLKKR